jgi:uncharacterized repeat protein (TIGR02543 family)
MPSNVIRIAPFAFANARVTAITIPNSASLSEGMFADSTTLTTVTLGSDFIHIPDNMFEGTTALTAVVAQGAITSIGDNAFRNSNISNFNAPQLQSMGIGAFAGSRIATFVFGAAFGDTIPSAAFDGATNLTTVNFGPNVRHIGARAFANTGLAGTVEGNLVQTIGTDAFANSRGIARIDFNVATQIGAGAFRLDERATDGVGGITVINTPAAIIIGNRAFLNQDRQINLGSLDNVIDVGAEAFMNTRASHGVLTQGPISMPNLQRLGDRAFMNNIALTSFVVGQYVGTPIPATDIPDDWSMGVPPVGATSGSFGQLAFRGIGNAAFAGTGLIAFGANLDNDIYFVQDGALLRRVAVGANQSELVAYPAAHTASSWIIPEGVVRISDQAFINNIHLQTVTMPTTLVSIGDRAFFNSNITTFEFTSFRAPNLEGWYAIYRFPGIGGIGGADSNPHVWTVIANFVGYFTPSTDTFIRDENGHVIGFDYDRFMFNPISRNLETDRFPLISEDPREGSRFTGTRFGLTIRRPVNALGFDTFVFANYFCHTEYITAVRSEATAALIEAVLALDLTALTLADEAHVNLLRAQYNALPEHQRVYTAPHNIGQTINEAVSIVGALFVADLIAMIDRDVPLVANWASNPANNTLMNNVGAEFSRIFNSRPHYLEFITNRERFFAIERIRWAGAFMATYQQLSEAGLVNIGEEHRALLVAAPAQYAAALGQQAEPRWGYMQHALAQQWQFVQEAMTRLPIQIQVTLQLYGTVYMVVDVAQGTPVTTIPTRAGYIFNGWQLNGQNFAANTPITSAITLTALWIAPQTFTVTFNSNGGSAVTAIQATEGQPITLPAAPTRSGYTFVGWTLDGENFDAGMPITSNIILRAEWEAGSGCGACGGLSPFSNAGGAGIALLLIVVMAVLVIVVAKKRKRA